LIAPRPGTGIPGHLTAFEPTRAAALRRVDAIHPGEYARTRNALDGAATGLSPYLTHGVLTMRETVARLMQRHRVGYDDKLVFEFAWREFFHHVWNREGERILDDLRPTPVWSQAYSRAVPADLREGRTGVGAIDAAVRQLYATGYLHNHARMWLASYAVHLRKVHWRAGADWMFGHLLDGDVPSNHLSWQWVAGTFSTKPYLFNAENVARYAPPRVFPAWVSAGTVIDRDYAALEQIARNEADVGPEPGRHDGVAEPALHAAPRPEWVGALAAQWTAVEVPAHRDIELVTPWALGEGDARGSGPGGGGPWRLGVVHTPAHALLPWSEARWRWMLQRMGEVCDAVWVGDVSTGVAHLGGRSDPTWNSLPLPAGVRAARAPFPAYDAALASRATLHPAARLLPDPPSSCRSFSVFYEAVKTQSRSLTAQLNGELS